MSTDKILRQYIPLNELTEENLHDIAEKTPIETLAKGKALFHKGDSDNFSFYLLTGKMVMVGDEEGGPVTVVGGSAPTRFPLDHHRPRHVTAIADSEDVTFFRINNDLLDILLTWDQNAGYMVTEIEEEEDNTEGDWMTMMLRTEIFHRIPPSNIQQVFARMEAFPVKNGDRVIAQGEEGDYYYFIKSGSAQVTHMGKSGKEIKLADLHEGQGFGEEALISDNRRNANVTMTSDGVLMRMGKADFVQLLKAPIVQSVNYAEGKERVNKGAIWLDVRLESEYKNAHIKNSLHIPLYLLRIKAPHLDKSKQYIVCCDTGRRSSSAAFLLSERGINASYLEDGLRGMAKEHIEDLERSEG